jgi:hypothetical protein
VSIDDRSALWGMRTSVFLPSVPPNPILPKPPPIPPIITKTLDVTIPQQQQSNWCWAAVGVGIVAFYGTTYSQCYVVTLVLTSLYSGFNINCCTTANPSDPSGCNRESGADQALSHPDNHFAGTFDYPLGMTDIETQINEERPFACGINWADGNGHFVAITGYRTVGSEPYVYVQDPATATTSFYTLSSFTSSYEGDGSWGWTSLSQP